MTDSPLIVKSEVFALDVIQACKKMRASKCEGTLRNNIKINERDVK